MEDGTDDTECPWFQVDAFGMELLFEFSPDGFTIRSYEGQLFCSLASSEYSLERVLSMFSRCASEWLGGPVITLQ